MTLVGTTILVAQEELRCDASADLVDQLYRTTDDRLRSRFLPVAYAVKFCKIQVGQKYKRYEFVDEDGELHNFNCVLRLDDFMIRNKLYPEYLLELINKK